MKIAILFLAFIFLSCASTDPLSKCIKLDKKLQKEIKLHPEKKDSLDHVRDSLWDNF